MPFQYDVSEDKSVTLTCWKCDTLSKQRFPYDISGIDPKDLIPTDVIFHKNEFDFIRELRDELEQEEDAPPTEEKPFIKDCDYRAPFMVCEGCDGKICKCAK